MPAYRFSRWMPGLQEEVEYVKTGDGVGAVDASGKMESVEVTHRRDWEAWYERHGSASMGVVKHLAVRSERGTPEDAPVRIGIWFPQPPRTVALAELKASTQEERTALRAARSEVLARVVQEPLARWESIGFETRRVSRYLPVVWGNATPDVLARLARDPDVRRITLDEPSRPVLDVLPSEPDMHVGVDFVANADPPNGVTDPMTNELNELGFYARGQRLGIVESPSCGVYDDHESLGGSLKVTHKTTPPSCSTDADCATFGLQTSDPAVQECRCQPNLGRCVGMHMHAVASVMMGNKAGENWGASGGRLFVYNDHVTGGSLLRCTPSHMDAAYEWFVDWEVTTVVQAFSCFDETGAHTTDEDGLVQDYYAREEGILVVKSAGNFWEGPGGYACPMTLNGLCVGAASAGGNTMWQVPGQFPSRGSSWLNWSYLNPDGIPVPSDREEPDLVALGVGVDYGVPNQGPTAWLTATGTSFSAPVVAQLAAVIKQACGYEDPRVLRAVLQVASGNRNVEGWKYSTPNILTEDWKDGAGGVESPFAYAFCTNGTDDWDTDAGVEPIYLPDGGQPPPSGGSPDPEDPPPGERAYLPGNDPSRQVKVMGGFQNVFVPAGKRIRAAIAWNSCPPQQYLSTLAPSAVATDFDLLLYRRGGEYVYLSQSIDDSTEGFDVEAPVSGRYTIYIAWPNAGQTCDGPLENVGWAYSIEK
jgi:hypothetical protein